MQALCRHARMQALPEAATCGHLKRTCMHAHAHSICMHDLVGHVTETSMQGLHPRRTSQQVCASRTFRVSRGLAGFNAAPVLLLVRRNKHDGPQRLPGWHAALPTCACPLACGAADAAAALLPDASLPAAMCCMHARKQADGENVCHHHAHSLCHGTFDIACLPCRAGTSCLPVAARTRTGRPLLARGMRLE